MVKPWEKSMEKGIKLTKFRIKHHEYHGNGKVATDEKYILQKQERRLKEYKK